MEFSDLKKYCDKALENHVTHAKPIHPSTVVTAPWVRFKCQFGCRGYGKSYCCPPDTPTPEQTQAVIDRYQRAILFHVESIPGSKEEGGRNVFKCFDMLVDLEGEMFKDGYYKALLFLAGPCRLCKECAKGKGEPCLHGHRSRPAMEAVGIDVYQTVRNNGFSIETLKEKGDPKNLYALMLVD
jgi:predicted metal-binding protein